MEAEGWKRNSLKIQIAVQRPGPQRLAITTPALPAHLRCAPLLASSFQTLSATLAPSQFFVCALYSHVSGLAGWTVAGACPPFESKARIHSGAV